MRTSSVLLVSLSCCNAFRFPISIPPFLQWAAAGPHRVAIIGAGAGGSSAAFWLSRAQNRTPEHNVFIDVFEKETYIGGRSTVVHPYESVEYAPVELGASIFVQANKNLWRATEEFNLSLASFDGEDSELGIWDGAEFRFRANQKNGEFGWWDMARLLWRYGINAPRRSQALVKKLIDDYLMIYRPSTPSWESVPAISSYLNFSELVAQTTEEYLDSQNIDKKYSSEIIEAMTRVNYGQNLNQIHALEGLVSQAATGASGVKGGNYKIFEQFLTRSNAKLYLNTTVESLTRKSNKWVLVTAEGESRTYDSIILAAPYHSTNITISPPLRIPIPEQPYIHLHVTYLSTSSPSPNPEYFFLKNDTTAPTTVLTTHDGFVNGGPEPEFTSLTYHGKVTGHNGRPSEYIVKIFSLKTLSDTWIRGAFGKVGWIYRKEWDAYPRLPPTTEFPPVKPDSSFYYVNSFEPFISTMETETISSLNAVQLLLTDVWGPNATSCPEDVTSKDESEVMKGWDC
ncbi:FAD/NAD(P)-binding domain-containing protein [Ramaria rubella]|nr:FAD/NAD(P)-binding domain-containing protein [Ramaria rubella]